MWDLELGEVNKHRRDKMPAANKRLCASDESAIDTDGERQTIRHFLTVSVEFAAEKYSERERKERPAKPYQKGNNQCDGSRECLNVSKKWIK